MFFEFKNQFPHSVEEQSNIFFNTHMRNQFLNSKIFCEEVDVSFEDVQEFSFLGFGGEHFDRLLKVLQLGKFCHKKQIKENSIGYHDLVA